MAHYDLSRSLREIRRRHGSPVETWFDRPRVLARTLGRRLASRLAEARRDLRAEWDANWRPEGLGLILVLCLGMAFVLALSGLVIGPFRPDDRPAGASAGPDTSLVMGR